MIVCELGLEFGALPRLKKSLLTKLSIVDFSYRYQTVEIFLLVGCSIQWFAVFCLRLDNSLKIGFVTKIVGI